MGTPALTTRGMEEEEFRQIADFMDRAVKIALKIQKTSGKMLKEFIASLQVLDDTLYPVVYIVFV